MKLWGILVLVLSGLVGASGPEVKLPEVVHRVDVSSAEGIAVLSGGRIKPLLVVAREGNQEIFGKSSLGNGLGPLQSWFALALYADGLSRQPLILCEYRPLREAIGLTSEGRWVSFRDLVANSRLRAMVEQADEKDKNKVRLSRTEKAAREVAERLRAFQLAQAGNDWRLFPGTVGDEGNWRLPYEVAPDELARDTALASRYTAFSALLQAFTLGDQAGFDAASARLAQNELLSDSLLRRAQGEALHTRDWHLKGELLLVHARPFRWTWVLLAFGMMSLYVSGVVASRKPTMGRACLHTSVYLAVAGFLVAFTGFVMRIVVSGRAPVTNMYETTLWVGFGAILFGLPIAWLYRSKIIHGCVLAAGFLLFLLADNMPSVLDPAIHPLVPVLRSNYWLTIHVLTVTISYAAFLVAMVLGNFGLWQYLRSNTPEQAHQQVAHFAYRAMQLGVFLLTTGIILGGIWADYSWGRFWGWDPKETWSLIADLGYLIVLHGRFTGWIRSFGTLMGAVLGFYGIVMAWYGVNFVLASGLHAYGFSQGGTTAMATYVLLQGAFAGYVAWHVRRRRAAGISQAA